MFLSRKALKTLRDLTPSLSGPAELEFVMSSAAADSQSSNSRRGRPPKGRQDVEQSKLKLISIHRSQVPVL